MTISSVVSDKYKTADKVEQNSLPVVLTVTEIAKLLRVNRNTVYEAFQKGAIPGGQKVGRCIRFSRDAVLQWLEGNVLTLQK